MRINQYYMLLYVSAKFKIMFYFNILMHTDDKNICHKNIFIKITYFHNLLC